MPTNAAPLGRVIFITSFAIPSKQRIKRWLEKADALAQGWIPSKSLFLDGI
jgi:hypothetical protein